MSVSYDQEDRLLSNSERELVDLTRSPLLETQSETELQGVGKRLRQARDRYRRIAHRQQREMRGKAEQPHGAVPARENAGSLEKVAALVEALKRVTAALRKRRAPTQTQPARKALEAKRAAAAPSHPAPGRTTATGMTVKASTRPTVRVDPRGAGRVSKAGKVAQIRRDR